jgi:hypothetical protein
VFRLLGTVTPRSLARVGGVIGVLSVIVTFVGSSAHGGLPDTATEASVRSYIASANAVQTGIGNFLELLGYLLFLVFAAFLYSTLREADAERRSWPALAALTGAIAYVAFAGIGIASQQAMVEWGKAGADAKTTLGLYIFDSDSFVLSFEFGALFLAGIGVALLGARGPLRLLAFSALAVAIVLFAAGLNGAASPGNGLTIIGFLLFALWTLVAAVYLVIRPIPSSSRA